MLYLFKVRGVGMKRPPTFGERIEKRLHEEAVERYNEAQVDEIILQRKEEICQTERQILSNM